MAAHKKVNSTPGVVVSKTDDGTVQMTFTIAWSEIQKAQEEAAKKLGADITVPGFRKGKAPLDAAMKHIPQESLVQEAVGSVLPPKITATYKANDVVPIMYPKIELLHAHDNEDWEIRATTAQLPEITLGDYKEKIKGALAADAIWTPEKGEDTKPKEKSPEEKENIALRTLLDSIEVKLPAILVEEEANHRVANLLARLEKLGLSLENYLASQKKDVQSLRAEYAQAATETLKLELILGKIADTEKVEVPESEIEEFAKMANVSDKNTVRSLLLKRKTIDQLVK